MAQPKKRPRNSPTGRRVVQRTSDEYTVMAWEGLGAAGLDRVAGRFARLCKRPGSFIEKEYTANLLKSASRRPRTAVVVAAVRSTDGYVAALAHCTLHSGLPGIAPRRIVFIDLVCSDAGHKGVGAVLLRELEAYARDTLGAQALVLQSVLDPRTQNAYYRKGFERGVGNRSAETLKTARAAFRTLNTLGDAHLKALLACAKGECRKRLAEQLSVARQRPSAEWKHALGGEYYPPYNSLYDGGDAFVMTKRLSQPRSFLMSLLWPRRAPDVGVVLWGSGDGYASFRSPKVRTLTTYARNAPAGRLVPR